MTANFGVFGRKYLNLTAFDPSIVNNYDTGVAVRTPTLQHFWGPRPRYGSPAVSSLNGHHKDFGARGAPAQPEEY